MAKRRLLEAGDEILILVKVVRDRPLSGTIDFSASNLKVKVDIITGSIFSPIVNVGSEAVFAIKHKGVAGWKWLSGKGKRNRMVRDMGVRKPPKERKP